MSGQKIAPTDETAVFAIDSWLRNVIYPLLTALLVTMLFLAVLSVIQIVAPGPPWLPLIALIFFVALEGFITTTWLRQYQQLALDRQLYRLAEFVIIAVVVRLFAWAATGSGLLTLAQLQHYLRFPLAFFDDNYFLMSLLLVVLAWQRGTAFSHLFNQLILSEAEKSYFSRAPNAHGTWKEDAPLPLSRSNLLGRFFNQWLWGGVVFILCTALSTVQLNEITTASNFFSLTRLGLQPQLLLAMLVYFLVGFWLLGQARLAVLNGRWLLDNVNKNENVSHHWNRSSLWLLLLIAIIAAFLPIGSTLPISRLLWLIVGVIAYIANFIFFIVSFLLVKLLALLFPRRPALLSEEAPAPPPLEMLTQPPSNLATNETLALIASSLFWTLLVVGTVVALLFFLRDRGYRINGRLLRRIWQVFTGWLHDLWQGLGYQINTLQQAIQTRLQKPTTANSSPPPWRFIRLSTLSPREQIRYFYLSTLKRASQQGVPRQPDETPLEFAQDLQESWPEAETEVKTLTEAFLKARYSPQPIPKEDVSPIKAHWKRVKTSLRRPRNQQ